MILNVIKKDVQYLQAFSPQAGSSMITLFARSLLRQVRGFLGLSADFQG